MSSFRKSSLSSDENASSAATKASNNLVVRIDQDSDDNLQELFDSVLNPGDSKRPLQVPFRMRKLPNSFFNPPAATARSPSISHSRANSADSAYDAGSQSNVNQQATVNTSVSAVSIVAAVNEVALTPSPASVAPPPAPATLQANPNNAIEAPKLAICHARAHSSPASLQQTYNLHTNSVGAANNATNNVNEAGVTDGSTGGTSNGNVPPFSASASGSGGSSGASAGGPAGFSLGLDRLNQCIAQQNANNPIPAFHMKQRSYDVISPIQLQSELGTLPPGWEQAKTNDGQIYYLNHITKSTQWEDPRIQYRLQQQQRAQQQLAQTVNMRNAPTAVVGATGAAVTAAGSAGVTGPPAGVPTNRETSAVSLGDTLGPLPEGWEQAFTESGDIYFINHVDRTTSWNDPRIPDFLQKSLKAKPEMSWVNVRQLEKDQDFFKQKTEQQNLLTRHSASHQMDPFLSGDSHARQESSDSGLSLSSNTFSVNTEFKSPIDDSMDCISENGTLNGLDCADNLVSSLQLDDSICDEMLYVHNMLNSPSAKPDNLEWYKIN